MLIRHFLNEVSQRVWWHGSFNGQIKRWKPFAHFGTWRAAVQRFVGRDDAVRHLDRNKTGKNDKKCYFYPVHLDFDKRNSIIYDGDLFTENPIFDFLSILRIKRSMSLEKKYPKTYEYLDHKIDFTGWNIIIPASFFAILKEEHLDVILYKNNYEDKSSKSAFVINPDIITYTGPPIIRSLERLYDTKFLNIPNLNYKKQGWRKPNPNSDISGI